MAYWRMQLHPAQPQFAARYSVGSLAAGFIGLDFAEDVGDLRRLEKDDLGEQKTYWPFAHTMQPGDWVLVIAHHYPVAITQIEGEYNYISRPDPGLGVWFRHFRRVRKTRYYADYRTNPPKWQQIKMTETIAPLKDPASLSYKPMDAWVKKIEAEQ